MLEDVEPDLTSFKSSPHSSSEAHINSGYKRYENKSQAS